MDDKKITEIIDRLMEGPFQRDRDEYSRTDPNVSRLAARSGTQTGEPDRRPEQPMSYQDWLKKQDKTGMPIGLHKNKKKK